MRKVKKVIEIEKKETKRYYYKTGKNGQILTAWSVQVAKEFKEKDDKELFELLEVLKEKKIKVSIRYMFVEENRG